MAAPFEAVGDHDGFDLLSELPQALALLVMKQLTLRQRAVCSLVSTSWRQLFALPALWETLILTAENSSAGSDLSQDATCEHLPIFTQLRIAARGHVRCLHLIGFSLPGRERGFLEFVLANSFLRELLVHDCALRAGEASFVLRRSTRLNKFSADLLIMGHELLPRHAGGSLPEIMEILTADSEVVSLRDLRVLISSGEGGPDSETCSAASSGPLLQRIAGLSTLLSNLRAVRTLDISCARGSHFVAKVALPALERGGACGVHLRLMNEALDSVTLEAICLLVDGNPALLSGLSLRLQELSNSAASTLARTVEWAAREQAFALRALELAIDGPVLGAIDAEGVAKLRTVCACSGPDGVALIIFGSAIGEAAVVAASDQPLLRNAAGGGMAASSVERDDFGGSRQQQLFPSGGRRLREEEDLRAGEALSALSLEDCQGAD